MPNMGIDSPPLSPSASGLADALFSTTRQKVLAYLFGHPDRSYYASELIALAGSGSGAVQRELSRLVHCGLVTMNRIGKQTHYQANTESPLFEELCSIVDKTVGLVGPIQSALAPLQNDINAAFIYGSVAKHMDHAGSDVDVMIISETLTYADTHSALETATSRILRTVNPSLYSHAEFSRLLQDDNAFIRRVMEQPKLWIIGSEDDLPAG